MGEPGLFPQESRFQLCMIGSKVWRKPPSVSRFLPDSYCPCGPGSFLLPHKKMPRQGDGAFKLSDFRGRLRGRPCYCPRKSSHQAMNIVCDSAHVNDKTGRPDPARKDAPFAPCTFVCLYDDRPAGRSVACRRAGKSANHLSVLPVVEMRHRGVFTLSGIAQLSPLEKPSHGHSHWRELF